MNGFELDADIAHRCVKRAISKDLLCLRICHASQDALLRFSGRTLAHLGIQRDAARYSNKGMQQLAEIRGNH